MNRFPDENDSERVLKLNEELVEDLESKRRLLQEDQYSTSDVSNVFESLLNVDCLLQQSDEEENGHLRCKQTTEEVEEDAWFH